VAYGEAPTNVWKVEAAKTKNKQQIDKSSGRNKLSNWRTFRRRW